MKKFIYYLLITLALCSITFGQLEKKPDLDSYNEELTNLQILKSELLANKTQLAHDIDSLKIFLNNLNEKLKTELEKLFTLKYGIENGARIAMGQVWKGMTENMLRDSWGKPDKVNTSKYSYGTFRQLYYGKIVYFFRDGNLIDWEETK